MSWSGGKDSCMALEALLSDPAWDVRGLLTSCTKAYGRIAIHGVRETLLQAQAAAIGLPLHTVYLPSPCSNQIYAREMGQAHQVLIGQGVEALGFGDLFLEDIRQYRENLLKNTPLQPVFPIWLEPTPAMAQRAARLLKTTLVCISHHSTGAPTEWAGRAYDQAFIQQIPTLFDPCGERGEFHTFVHDAPCFRAPLAVTVGEIVERDGCMYADLLLA